MGTGFQSIISECGCAVDEFFVGRGGNCITGEDCDVCAGSAVEAHFDEPYIASKGGHLFEMHVAGAKLTLESGQSTPGSADASADGAGVGRCDGQYVSWDSARQQCMPDVEYMTAGTRVLRFNALASRKDLAEATQWIRQASQDLETRVNSTLGGLNSIARAFVSGNQDDIDRIQAQTDDIHQSIETGLSTLEEEIVEHFSAVEDEIREGVEERIDDLEEMLSGWVEPIQKLYEEMEHTTYMDHSLPVYRWAVWSSYSQHHGWYNHNQREFFGGVHPSWWGDDWNRGRASDLSGNKDVLRGLFNKRGFCGWQCTVWANEWYYYSSTNSKHVGTLFRIHNTRDSNVNWPLRFRYSSYGGWGERASTTLNGQDIWSTTGNCAYCDCHLNLNMPGGRTSTVVVIAGSNHPSGTRTNLLTYTHNSLRLPDGLEYRDDMDYAQGGWDS